MAFSTIIVATLLVYLVYYAINIIYDILVASRELSSVTEDEEIEITEDDSYLESVSYFTSFDDQEEEIGDGDENIAEMNGSLTIDELCSKMQETTFPSELDILAQSWIAH